MGLYLRAAPWGHSFPGTAGLLGLWSLESCESLQAKRCHAGGWKTGPENGKTQGVGAKGHQQLLLQQAT